MFIYGLMVINTKVNGLTTEGMVMALISLIMAMYILVSTKKANLKALVSTDGLMGHHTLVSSKMGLNKV